MEGGGHFFSQGSSSNAGRSASVAGIDDDDLRSYAHQQPAPPRSAMSNLDLNSHGVGFPDLGSYTGLLQSDNGIGRSARQFQPPRPSAVGAEFGGGGSLQLGRGGGGGRQASRSGGGGRQAGHGGGGGLPGNQLLPAQGRGQRLPPLNTGAGVGRGAPARGRRTRRPAGRGRGAGASSSGTAGYNDDEDDTSEDEWIQEYVKRCKKRRVELAISAAVFGMYHFETYWNKREYRNKKPIETGYKWVTDSLARATYCYDNFRMNRHVFDRLHNVLVEKYGLRSTRKMSSVEALALFLWMCGCPQGMRQADDRFKRSKETCSRKFEEVLDCLDKLGGDIIRPLDPEFTTVHKKLQAATFSPYFDKCIGAIDGTHVRVVVPTNQVVQHTGRKGHTTQNVLAICDFDMRFTFVVAGWPGSAHDMRVFKDSIQKYADKFPHPTEGKFYLVDSGYPNRTGYLAPYRGTKYHLPEFRQGPMPRGKKELFNFAHSSLRSVIERCFGVLKNKWRILRDLPSYPMSKQSKIIMACMSIHNFIRESDMEDVDFARCDNDENYVPLVEEDAAPSQTTRSTGTHHGNEDQYMNRFRDWIADGLFMRN